MNWSEGYSPDPIPSEVKDELHSWPQTPKEAAALQRKLREQIHTSLPLGKISRISGVDVAYIGETGESLAAIAVLRYPGLDLLDFAIARVETPFPYVPGLLSFREIPPILQAFRLLSKGVDLVFVDGHGMAHPRRMGIASHLGLWLEKPTIGIGKSRLCGSYEEPGPDKGCQSELWDKGELVGTVLRTRPNVRPIFVSVGYGIPLEKCVEMTLQVTPRYRLPEPIRWADRLAAQNKTPAGASKTPTDPVS
jgi:deoxyribonuclease V